MSKKNTIAQHLHDMHEGLSSHHGRMAKMAKAAGDKDVQAEHEDMAEYHSQMAEECDSMPANKAAGLSELDLNRLIPIPGISTVYKNDIRPVIRPGQPPMPSGERPNIPPEFQKLVEIEDNL